MKQKEKMINDFLEEIDGYFMQLVYTKDLISVENDINRNRYKMECSPNFTLIVECALSDSCLLSFMKLYDKSKKTKTVLNLINKCE